MRKSFFLKVIVGFSLMLSPFGSAGAWAQNFSAGSFAGGMLGGIIAGAMMSSAQRQPAAVYSPRVRYRAAPRPHVAHHVVRRHVAPKEPSGSAVVDTSADPFAAKAGGLTAVSTK